MSRFGTGDRFPEKLWQAKNATPGPDYTLPGSFDACKLKDDGRDLNYRQEIRKKRIARERAAEQGIKLSDDPSQVNLKLDPSFNEHPEHHDRLSWVDKQQLCKPAPSRYSPHVEHTSKYQRAPRIAFTAEQRFMERKLQPFSPGPVTAGALPAWELNHRRAPGITWHRGGGPGSLYSLFHPPFRPTVKADPDGTRPQTAASSATLPSMPTTPLLPQTPLTDRTHNRLRSPRNKRMQHSTATAKRRPQHHVPELSELNVLTVEEEHGKRRLSQANITAVTAGNNATGAASGAVTESKEGAAAEHADKMPMSEELAKPLYQYQARYNTDSYLPASHDYADGNGPDMFVVQEWHNYLNGVVGPGSYTLPKLPKGSSTTLKHKLPPNYILHNDSPGPKYFAPNHSVEANIQHGRRIPAFPLSPGDFYRPTVDKPLPIDRSTWLRATIKKTPFTADAAACPEIQQERVMPLDTTSPGSAAYNLPSQLFPNDFQQTRLYLDRRSYKSFVINSKSLQQMYATQAQIKLQNRARRKAAKAKQQQQQAAETAAAQAAQKAAEEEHKTNSSEHGNSNHTSATVNGSTPTNTHTLSSIIANAAHAAHRTVAKQRGAAGSDKRFLHTFMNYVADDDSNNSYAHHMTGESVPSQPSYTDMAQRALANDAPALSQRVLTDVEGNVIVNHPENSQLLEQATATADSQNGNSAPAGKSKRSKQQVAVQQQQAAAAVVDPLDQLTDEQLALIAKIAHDGEQGRHVAFSNEELIMLLEGSRVPGAHRRQLLSSFTRSLPQRIEALKQDEMQRKQREKEKKARKKVSSFSRFAFG